MCEAQHDQHTDHANWSHERHHRDDTRRAISYQLLQLQLLVLDEFAATQLRKHLACRMLTSSQSASTMLDDQYSVRNTKHINVKTVRLQLIQN